jgi:hypothetical protein
VTFIVIGVGRHVSLNVSERAPDPLIPQKYRGKLKTLTTTPSCAASQTPIQTRMTVDKDECWHHITAH